MALCIWKNSSFAFLRMVILKILSGCISSIPKKPGILLGGTPKLGEVFATGSGVGTMQEPYLRLLNLAQRLQPHLRRFYLAGGTALMLKHRHRLSSDLDFFSYYSFSFRRLVQKVRTLFQVEKEEAFEDNVDLWIEGTKVSFIYFPFANIRQTEEFLGIRMASDYDIFLNKIYAAGRRVDPKDPQDVAFLYEKYGWNRDQIKRDFMTKFPGQSYELYLGALLSFEDYPELPESFKSTLLKLVER